MTDTNKEDNVQLIQRMAELVSSIASKSAEISQAAHEDHDLWTAKAISDIRDDLKEAREILTTLHLRMKLDVYHEQFNKTLASIFPNPSFNHYK